MTGAASALERMSRFATEEVRGREDLNEPGLFPHDLWELLGREGLLGLGVPEAFGRSAASIIEQADLAEALARRGRSLGLTVAWQSHNTLTRYFFGRFASPAQQAHWMPQLAAGDVTPAVAISEPGSGAHPKHLKTTATEDSGGFRLNGEKAFVTNGPIAGVYIVVAVTGTEAGRKRFTAFLVKRGTPGLSYTEAGAVHGLYPVGHCGLRFEDCRVPRDAVLGNPGSAYEEMAQPLRDYEDMLGIATLTGGMGAVLDILRDASLAGAIEFDRDARERIGGMEATRAAVAQLGRTVLAGDPAQSQGAILLLAARRLVQDFLSDLDQVAPASSGIPELPVLRRDLGILGGVARQVVRLRLGRLGDSVLSRPA